MLEVLRSTKDIRAARIGRIAVVLLIATSSSGCATLMQPFSAVQPTAAIVEPDWIASSDASDEVSTSFAAPDVGNQWITRVYRESGLKIGVADM